jgi:broad specificity phosphatase PhoE/hemerythrin-like domain-containing protein
MHLQSHSPPAREIVLMLAPSTETLIMGIQIVFETHSISEDNEHGIATGWHDGRLSERGRILAGELGARRKDDGIAAVFSSDLGRAVETARIAFAQIHVPILADWRLRECDYGSLNGQPAEILHRDRQRYLDTPYPDGESWRQAIQRVGRFLPDLRLRWDDARVLVIGHVATRWAFDHLINGMPLEELIGADFGWREEFLAIHNMFRNELGAMLQFVDSLVTHQQRLTGSETATQVQALAQATYRYTQMLHFHHHGETGSLFPTLRAQGLDDPIIARLNAEHDQIAVLIDRLEAAVQTAALFDARVVDADLRLLAEALRKHLDYEEAHVCPLLTRFSGWPLH